MRELAWLAWAACLGAATAGCDSDAAVALARLANASAEALPSAETACRDSLAHDVDGDGDLDLVVAREGADHILENDGGGVFSETGRLVGTEAVTADLALVDVDGDGAEDIVAVGPAGAALYRDQGRGFFADESGRLPPAAGTAVSVGDLNGDGAPDLVVEGAAGRSALVGDGQGFFVDETPVYLPPAGPSEIERADLILAELSGDGEIDLLSGRLAGDQLLLGQDAGVLVPGPPAPERAAPATDLELALLNDDAAADVLVAAAGVRAWTGSAGGVFVDETRARIPPEVASDEGILDIDTSDFDQDGTLDRVVTGERDVDQAIIGVLLDAGDGTFVSADVTISPEVTGSGIAATAADFSGDGFPDVFVCTPGGDVLLLSQP